jgi:hypothetical protein
MQSPDWPDLPFVQAKAFGTGRDGRSAKYSVIHYTAGSERSTSAEDGAAYDQRRTDGTSTHYFHDQNSTVQCVLLANRANAAFHKGNRLGIQHELCGTIQTREQWLDPASLATIDRAAYQVARDHKRFGIPIRRLSPAQVRACWYDGAPGGICGHVDVTLAYPEDGGTHTDPGTAFPWDVFMDRVQLHFEGVDMAQLDDVQAAVNRIEQGSVVPSNALIYWIRTMAEGRASGASGGVNQGPDRDGIPEVLTAIAALPADLAAQIAIALAGNPAFINAIADPVAAAVGAKIGGVLTDILNGSTISGTIQAPPA